MSVPFLLLLESAQLCLLARSCKGIPKLIKPSKNHVVVDWHHVFRFTSIATDCESVTLWCLGATLVGVLASPSQWLEKHTRTIQHHTTSYHVNIIVSTCTDDRLGVESLPRSLTETGQTLRRGCEVLSGIRWTILKSKCRSAALVALLAIGSFAGPALG